MLFKLRFAAISALILSSSLAFADQASKEPAKAETKATNTANTTNTASKDGNKPVSFKDAVPCPIPAKLMDGFYVGAIGGYDTYHMGQNIDMNAGGSQNTMNPKTNANGIVGGILAGLGRTFKDFYYLGGEFTGTYSNAATSWTANLADINGGTPGVYSSKIYVNQSAGIALLPGLKTSDTTLVYLHLGYNWANIRYLEDALLVGSVNKTNTVHGFSYGLGLETLLTTNWSVRGEYTHTNYNSFSTSMNTGSVSTVDPSNNQFMLGLLFHFA